MPGLARTPPARLSCSRNESATLSGKLTGIGGQIANAPLCVFSRVVTDQARQFLGIAMSGSAGEYQFAIGSGPSRDVAAVYRPDQRELTATAELKTRGHPTFRLRNKVVKNRVRGLHGFNSRA